MAQSLCTQHKDDQLINTDVLEPDVAGVQPGHDCEAQQAACEYLVASLVRFRRLRLVCEVGLLLPHLGHHSSLHQASQLLKDLCRAEGGGV